MAKLTPNPMIALATLAAIVAGLATPAFAKPYRSGVERGDFIYVPADRGCIGNPAPCDLARY